MNVGTATRSWLISCKISHSWFQEPKGFPTKNTACNLQLVLCVLGRELIMQVGISPTYHQEPAHPTVKDGQLVGFSVLNEKYCIKQLIASQNEANFTTFFDVLCFQVQKFSELVI